MNDKPTGPQGLSITPADIVYAVFRQKWKIVAVCVLGFGATAMLPFVLPRMYQSEAKLFVKYVVETKSPSQGGVNTPMETSEESANAINTETEILTSRDSAQRVVDIVGPERILSKAGGGANRFGAADFIHQNLMAESTKGSKVIRVTFKHPDPEVAQTVLGQVIQVYLKRHEEVHRPVGAFDEVLTRQTDELQAHLKQTEELLKKAKKSAGVMSLDDSKKAYTQQISGIRERIVEAEAELAERKSTVEELQKLLHETPVAVGTTNQVATSNSVVTASAESVAEYKKICLLLDSLRKREQDLLAQFTPENSFVKEVETQIGSYEKRKEQLEQASPELVAVRPLTSKDTTSNAPDASTSLRASLITESTRAKALQSKIDVLTDQLIQVRKEAGAVEEAEGSITELQRTRMLQEKNFEYFKQTLESSQFDQALGAGRAFNISTIQEPSPSVSVSKLKKLVPVCLVGTLGLAFGLAFLIEFLLDNSVKRSAEVSSKLGLPLFMSIPRLRLGGKGINGNTPLLANGVPAANSNGNGHEQSLSVAKANGKNPNAGPQITEVAAWDPRHSMRPFCEALRDRVITFFEVNNLTHKPKLVAVTSCSSGAGVSTVATSLAASLSETGEGNVLLVNMAERDGTVHQFFKGDLACGLDDVLDGQNREQAMVQEKLYVVSGTSNSDQLPLPLPRRFKHLVPKLRASDYDYIIFDMPIVNQVSVTPRLARFMDFVVMVVESEHTKRDTLKRACGLLAESKANVGVVLNKGRRYLPKWLDESI